MLKKYFVEKDTLGFYWITMIHTKVNMRNQAVCSRSQNLH